MNFIDLFSGIGGFNLGAKWAGWKFDKEFHSDIDVFANKVYAKNFPNSIQLGDITKIDYEKLKEENKGEWIATGGFRVSRTRQQEKGKVQMMSAIFGTSVLGCFGYYDPNTQSLKTSQHCLFQTSENFSTEFLQIYPKSGIMRNGILFRLKRSERNTSGREFSLLPTPQKFDMKQMFFTQKALLKKRQGVLTGESSFSLTLAGVIKLFFNRPMNPEFAEWMMGFPKDWTLLESEVVATQ